MSLAPADAGVMTGAMAAPAPNRPVVPSAVLGTLIFAVAEVMFFVGMISAFTISRSGAPAGTWPVPGQPMLPKDATLVNTIALVLSGLVLLAAQVLWAKKKSAAKWLVVASWVLGLSLIHISEPTRPY